MLVKSENLYISEQCYKILTREFSNSLLGAKREMADFFNFLNQNSGPLLVFFTAIVALSTGFYVWLTSSLVRETRKMRSVQTEPCIDITFKPRDEWLKSNRYSYKKYWTRACT